MAAGDINIYKANGTQGSRRFAVAAGATAILAGEPVVKALGAVSVTAAADGTPVVGTDYVVGIAASNSTQTASVAGYVDVTVLTPGMVIAGKPKTAASWDTQSEYNALTGKRVVFDLTSGSYTIDATDDATNGLVVEYVNVTENPNLVAVAVRNAALYYA